MLEAARLKAVVVAETGTAQRDLDKFGGQVNTLGGRMQSGLRGAAAGAGRALQGLGTAAGFAFTAGIESASVFQDELATINTVARLPEEAIQGIGDEIQGLSAKTGKTTSDLSAAFYDMVSAGVDASDAMGVLESASTLAIGGLGSVAETTDLVTSAMNAYGLGADQAGHITDVFAKAIEAGKVTAAEIGSTLSQVAPIASSAGISLEEVAAGYATLTAKGTPAAQAATQMRAAISSLLTPNEQLNKIQEQTGINFAQLAEEKGLAVAMDTLREATSANASALDELAGVTAEDFPAALAAAQDELGLTNSEVEKFSRMAGKDGAAAAMNELVKEVGSGDSAFAKALGSVESYQFALNATGDGLEGFQDATQAGFDAAGTAAEQAAIKMDSPVEAGKRLAAQFNTFLQDVAGPFAGQFGPVVMMLNQSGSLMGGMITPARLLGGLIGNLGGGIVKMAAMAVPAFGSMLGPIVALAAPLAVPIAIVAAIVAAVAGLFIAWQNNFLGIRDIAANVWNAISGFIGGAIEFIGGVISGFIGFLGTIWNGVTGAASAVWGAVTGFVNTAASNIRGFIQGVISFVSTIWNGVSGAASAAWGAVTGVVRGAVGAITGIIGGIVDVARGVWNTVSGIFGAIGDAAASVGGFISNPVGSIGGFVGGLLPSFDVGAWEIPNDTLAMVHQGEMILPPDVAEALRSFIGGGGAASPPPATQAPAAGPGAAGGQGNTIIEHMEVNVPVTGLLRAEKPADVANVMRRVAALGYLTPRPAKG